MADLIRFNTIFLLFGSGLFLGHPAYTTYSSISRRIATYKYERQKLAISRKSTNLVGHICRDDHNQPKQKCAVKGSVRKYVFYVFVTDVTVSSVHPDLPLPSWQRTIIPCWDTASDVRHGITPSPAVRVYIEPNGSAITTSYIGWPGIPRGCGTSLELIPTSVRSLSSYLTFRRNLKSLLFDASFQDDWT